MGDENSEILQRLEYLYSMLTISYAIGSLQKNEILKELFFKFFHIYVHSLMQYYLSLGIIDNIIISLYKTISSQTSSADYQNIRNKISAHMQDGKMKAVLGTNRITDFEFVKLFEATETKAIAIKDELFRFLELLLSQHNYDMSQLFSMYPTEIHNVKEKICPQNDKPLLSTDVLSLGKIDRCTNVSLSEFQIRKKLITTSFSTLQKISDYILTSFNFPRTMILRYLKSIMVIELQNLLENIYCGSSYMSKNSLHTIIELYRDKVLPQAPKESDDRYIFRKNNYDCFTNNMKIYESKHPCKKLKEVRDRIVCHMDTSISFKEQIALLDSFPLDSLKNMYNDLGCIFLDNFCRFDLFMRDCRIIDYEIPNTG